MTNHANRSDLVGVALNYAEGGCASRSVPIRDGRAITAQLSLDQQGFELRHHETNVSNFYDASEVRALYYPEVERLLKAAVGATKVLAFEHDVRSASRPGVGEVRGPVHVVHDDYTERSAPERARLYLPNEADRLLRDRFAVINVWRPIRDPVRDTPLAVCDAQSLVEEDLIPTAEGVKHEVYLFRYNQNHRWFYFPAMCTDEALLIKCFDSIRDGRARFTAHAAFNDPSAPPDAPARESIEVRALAFFGA
jgi:hypothetical protein